MADRPLVIVHDRSKDKPSRTVEYEPEQPTTMPSVPEASLREEFVSPPSEPPIQTRTRNREARQPSHGKRSPKYLTEDIRQTREQIDLTLSLLKGRLANSTNIYNFGGNMIGNIQNLIDLLKRNPTIPAFVGLGLGISTIAGKMISSLFSGKSRPRHENPVETSKSGHASEAAPRSVSGMHVGYEPRRRSSLQTKNAQMAVGAVGLAAGLTGLYLAAKSIFKDHD